MDISFYARKSSQNSQLKGQTMAQKNHQANGLVDLIKSAPSFRAPDMLFGYLLGSSAIETRSRDANDLKRHFDTIITLFFDKVLQTQTLAMIVVDSLNQKKRMYGCTEGQKIRKMFATLQQNVEESMMDNSFVSQKWARQSRIDEENKKNEELLRTMMEEEKMAHRRKAQQAQAQGWQCPVCISEIDRDAFGLLECGHIFHPECINGYLKAKIESNEVQIQCPMDGCGKKLSVSDIYNFTDGILREKYQKFSFNNFVEMSEETNWCPTAGCTAVFAAQQDLDNYRCPICHKHYCLNCKCDYHNGMTCAQYRVSRTFDKNDQAFVNFVKGAKFKQCPRCKYWVERNKGCSTMTCKCGQEFCYTCGGTSCPHGSCNNSGRK